MNFKFQNKNLIKPKRVIVLGTSGIISVNLQKKLKKHNVKFIKIGKKNIDFKKKKSIQFMRKKIKDGDFIIFISAEAPAKNLKMKKNNIYICKNICSALEKKNIQNLIYISSDAVYSDTRKKIKENSLTKPNSIHGKMHLQREKILKKHFNNNFCIIRPTLVYGPGDTHLGYGPNRFINLALTKKEISLFGNGEERRDHIYIDDLISILYKCILFNAVGTINAITGKIYSFLEIAELTNKISKNNSSITKSKRVGPMPHNGYRPFENSLLKNYFKELKIKKMKDGIKHYISQIR